MCRSIKTLYNLDPPATEEEVRAASLQFVRKLSGFARPAQVNAAAFAAAVDEVAAIAARLMAALETPAAPRTREEDMARARARAARSATAPVPPAPSVGFVASARRL